MRGDDDSQLGADLKDAGNCFVHLHGLGVIGFFWSFRHFAPTNVDVASEHGELIENMFIATLVVTSIVFVLCNAAFHLRADVQIQKGREAVHTFAHSNKLEFFWTVVPTIVLTGLVVFDCKAWTRIMGPPEEDAVIFEMTGQQFF